MGQPAREVAFQRFHLIISIIFSASQRRCNSAFKFNRIPGGRGRRGGSKGWMKRKYLVSLLEPIPHTLLKFSAIINPKGSSNTSPSWAAHSAPAQTRGDGGEAKAGVCRQGCSPQHARRGDLRTNPAKLTLYRDKYVPLSGYQFCTCFYFAWEILTRACGWDWARVMCAHLLLLVAS